MGQGFPLIAHNTGRVPTLSGIRREGKQLGLGIKSGLRDDRGVSQGFLYTVSFKTVLTNLTLDPKLQYLLY